MQNKRKEKLKNLENILGYKFVNSNLLNLALTHRSFNNIQFKNNNKQIYNNERLEFLGDAVLELCIRNLLIQRFSNYNEGQLSKIRSLLVNENSLAEISKKILLGNYLLLGKGEEITGGRKKSKILSNSFEAILAAIYLDSNLEKVFQIVKVFFEPLLPLNNEFYSKDFKTLLQEKTQELFKIIPKYQLINEFGPDHNKTFIIEVEMENYCIKALGIGKTKKEAEQKAAFKAFKEIITLK